MKNFLKLSLLVYALNSVGYSAATNALVDLPVKILQSEELDAALKVMSENSELRIDSLEKMVKTETFRCPGCFEYQLTFHAAPTNGRQIMLVIVLNVKTKLDLATKEYDFTVVEDLKK